MAGQSLLRAAPAWTCTKELQANDRNIYIFICSAGQRPISPPLKVNDVRVRIYTNIKALWTLTHTHAHTHLIKLIMGPIFSRLLSSLLLSAALFGWCYVALFDILLFIATCTHFFSLCLHNRGLSTTVHLYSCRSPFPHETFIEYENFLSQSLSLSPSLSFSPPLSRSLSNIDDYST